VIQETLKTPLTTTNNMEEIQHVSTSEGTKKNHRSLKQETMKTPRISRYPVAGEIVSQVHQVESGETWMTAYQRYLVDEVLPLDPAKPEKSRKLFSHRFTHPILVCVDGEHCTRIMAELHEGISDSHISD